MKRPGDENSGEAAWLSGHLPLSSAHYVFICSLGDTINSGPLTQPGCCGHCRGMAAWQFCVRPHQPAPWSCEHLNPCTWYLCDTLMYNICADCEKSNPKSIYLSVERLSNECVRLADVS